MFSGEFSYTCSNEHQVAGTKIDVSLTLLPFLSFLATFTGRDVTSAFVSYKNKQE